MSSRDTILQRLAKAAPDGQHPAPALPADDSMFHDYPDETPAALLQAFAERLTALNGEFYAVATAEEAGQKLLHLISGHDPSLCLAQDDELVRSALHHAPELAGLVTSKSALQMPSAEFARLQVGITAADALVARTGSILLRATNAGGRRLSVLPPFHIVLARTDQLVPSLEQAFAGIAADDSHWSYATFITGPSRTADIEKILVLGAHGPKRLAVVMVTG